jgi:hypothetical protein
MASLGGAGAGALGDLGLVAHCGEGALNGVRTVLGVPDLSQVLLGSRVGRFRERPEDVGDLVKPAPLLLGLGEHLTQCAPESQRAIADL